MGLDMYLYASAYASEYIGKDFFEPVKAAATTIQMPIYDDLLAFTIRSKAAYWRKANQIHKWFVDNCQEGVDDCREAHVEIDQLKALRALCADLLKSKSVARASEELPPQDGFFFGSTSTDAYYWREVESTINQLDAILANPNAEKFEYYYHSSW